MRWRVCVIERNSAYQQFYGGDAVALFGVDEKGSLQVFTAEETITPKSGWTIVSLVSRQGLDREAKPLNSENANA